jgi:MFS family permease
MVQEKTVTDKNSDSSWRNRTVLGFSLASLMSDASHEMATAVLPLYLQSLGLGASVLGAIEGLADVGASLAKWLSGTIGQRLRAKKGITAWCYGVTTTCVGGFAFAATAPLFIVLRTVAWLGRGFRGPLRDSMMASAVEPKDYGKAFGLERAGDMLGAVIGPLLAALFVALALTLPQIFLITLIPGFGAVAAVVFLVKERRKTKEEIARSAARPSLPGRFWAFLGVVLLFGMGDFSRTFLILEGGRRLPPGAGTALLAVPVLLYVLHNAVSGVMTFPSGLLADKWSYGKTLAVGYGLGFAFNLGLAFLPGGLWWLVPLFLISGTYIAVEETVEKASAARMIPEESRSYALGMLATSNAVGDLFSSVSTGYLLDHFGRVWAYGLAAVLTGAGFVALLILVQVVKLEGERI